VFDRLRQNRCKYIAKVYQEMRCFGTVSNAAGGTEEFVDTALIMDYCPSSLQHVARGGLLDLTTTTVLVQQLAHCLQDCHTAGVAHMDIKPENVLLSSRTSEARLTDFGFAVERAAPEGHDAAPTAGGARAAAAAAGDSSSSSSMATGYAPAAPAAGAGPSSSTQGTMKWASGAGAGAAVAAMHARHPESVMVDHVLGCTFAYAAPEAIMLVHPSASGPRGPAFIDAAKCDMWSLGVMIFAMVFRSLPFGTPRECGAVSARDFLDRDPALVALRRRDVAGFWSVQTDRGRVQPEASDSPGHVEVARWIDHLLAWEPSERPHASDLLKHPWLVAAIPSPALGQARSTIAARVAATVSDTRRRLNMQSALIGSSATRSGASRYGPGSTRSSTRAGHDVRLSRGSARASLGAVAPSTAAGPPLHGPVHPATLGFLPATALIPATLEAVVAVLRRAVAESSLRLLDVGPNGNTFLVTDPGDDPSAVPAEQATTLRAIVTAHRCSSAEVGSKGASALRDGASALRLAARVEAGDAGVIGDKLQAVFDLTLERCR